MSKSHISQVVDDPFAPLPVRACHTRRAKKSNEMLQKTAKKSNEMLQKTVQLTPKQKGFALLRAEGLSVEKASEMVGNHPRTGYQMEKTLRKYDLTNIKMLSLAHKAVKSIVQGLPVGESEPPKPSTILEAARMSMDRAFPVKQVSETTATVTVISDEQRRRYHEALGLPIIDVTP